MKTKKQLPLCQQRKPKTKMKLETPESMVLREAVALPGIGLAIPVRAAKAKFSALLEMVADGREVTITSNGKPKVKLIRVQEAKPRKIFRGMGDYLMKQLIHRGSADEAISWTRGEG